MRRLVLDTNVLISGMINPNGAPGRIVDLLREGQIELVVDDRILEEYVRVLRRPYFARYFTQTECEDIIRYLDTCTYRIVPDALISNLPHPGDAPFAETAISADAPLVTGNLKHFPKRECLNLQVMTPKQFLAK